VLAQVIYTADVLTWAGDELLAPVLTGIAVGLALRGAAIPGEVASHDAEAEASNTDLIRWVRDRDRQLNGEVFHALNMARQGIIEDVAQPPVPKDLENAERGSQEYSGAFIRRVQRLMRQALHEYRDETSRKVRAYRTMARSEGWSHQAWRWWPRLAEPAPLELPEDVVELLGSWRERPIPVRPVPNMEAPIARVTDDPTRSEDAREIRALEGPGGLDWNTARARTT
jgi:hypothetical protein